LKVLFDTTVLVAAVVDQLPNHEAALACFSHYAGSIDHVGCCSTHALAECYATLTAIPLPKRVQPAEACLLIEENFINRLKLIELSGTDYAEAIRRASGLGLSSGVIYDALHLACAEKASCERIYTYNLSDFQRFRADEIEVLTP